MVLSSGSGRGRWLELVDAQRAPGTLCRDSQEAGEERRRGRGTGAHSSGYRPAAAGRAGCHPPSGSAWALGEVPEAPSGVDHQPCAAEDGRWPCGAGEGQGAWL